MMAIPANMRFGSQTVAHTGNNMNAADTGNDANKRLAAGPSTSSTPSATYITDASTPMIKEVEVRRLIAERLTANRPSTIGANEMAQRR